MGKTLHSLPVLKNANLFIVFNDMYVRPLALLDLTFQMPFSYVIDFIRLYFLKNKK